MNQKAVYQLLIDTWNTADFSRTAQWLAEDYVSHYGLADQQLPHSPREAFMLGVKWFRSVTPDFVFKINEDDDFVKTVFGPKFINMGDPNFFENIEKLIADNRDKL